MNIKLILAIFLFPTLFLPFPSSAHKLNLFVWTENNTITVESSLSGGRTLVHGMVTVVDTSSGKTIVSGETDADGVFSFSLAEEIVKQSLPLDIIVSAGDGHQAHWLLKGEDYGGTADSAVPLPPPENQLFTQQADPGACSCLDEAEFERLLDKQLERKLAPIRKNIGRLVDPSPSIRDIGAGIGYLLGCAGMIAWFRSRKQNKCNTTKGEQ
jgi:nickel transport protein